MALHNQPAASRPQAPPAVGTRPRVLLCALALGMCALPLLSGPETIASNDHVVGGRVLMSAESAATTTMLGFSAGVVTSVLVRTFLLIACVYCLLRDDGAAALTAAEPVCQV